MNIKLSIIIATFNAGKTLQAALNSIREQSFQEWECIIIDGASTDQTMDITKKFANIDARFRYISEPDKGIYDAFNKGWKLAKGEWIYYLGADDILLKDAIITIQKEFNNNNDIVYGNVIYKTAKKLIYKKSSKNISILRKHMPFSHQSVFMRKSIIEEFNGFDLKYKVSADFDLCQRCFLNKKKFKYIDTDIAIFYNMGESSGLNSCKDSYRLRKYNKSINRVDNVCIFITSIIKIELRRIKRFLHI